MTLMRLREMLSCRTHQRAVIVLEDVGQRVRLTFHADPDEARRLGQELRRGRSACHPIYDFIGGLLQVFQAAPVRVVLDDVQGAGIGALIHLRTTEAQLAVPCYPTDAVALALRASLPIYATPGALDHAQPAPPLGAAPDEGGEVRQWLEEVKPEDFWSAPEEPS